MKNKLTVYATMAVITASTLVGCGQSTKNINDTSIVKENNKKTNEPQGKLKKFKPGKHVFYIRKKINESRGRVKVPAGYQVFDVENYVVKNGEGSSTAGCYIWYVNKKTVEVEGKFDKITKKYTYNSFGKVVKQEKTTEAPKEKVK